jgi:hypothetical protein
LDAAPHGKETIEKQRVGGRKIDRWALSLPSPSPPKSREIDSVIAFAQVSERLCGQCNAGNLLSELPNQRAVLVFEALCGIAEGLHGAGARAGLDANLNVVVERVWVLVARKFHLRVAQELPDADVAVDGAIIRRRTSKTKRGEGRDEAACLVRKDTQKESSVADGRRAAARRTHMRRRFPRVWSSRATRKVAAFGTFSSGTSVILWTEAEEGTSGNSIEFHVVAALQMLKSTETRADTCATHLWMPSGTRTASRRSGAFIKTK